tara:strand:- start:211 stop:561 length:351 start_codon:yes stop_codon:yes gene_type:complete
MRSKNPYAKTRPESRPYFVYQGQGFTYKILKTYQTPENEAKNPHARAFCLTITEFTGPRGELGDAYWSSIKSGTRLVYQDPTITPSKPVELREVVNGTDYDSGDALTEAYNILFER